MSAMSYLLMVYKWWQMDVVGKVAVYQPGDLRYLLSVPVDPRTVIRGPMRPEGVSSFALNQNDGINEGQDAAPPTAPVGVPAGPNFVHIPASFRAVGIQRVTSNGIHLGARRGPTQLVQMIANREAFFGPAKRAALEAAQGDSIGGVLQLAPKIQTAIPTAGMTKVMAQQLPNLQMKTVAQVKTESQANCEAGGGYYEPATGYCKPTAETEAACRATNGIPYWDPINKYKCLPPGQAPPIGPSGGGGIMGIALLAGAAYLIIAKFMK
jgi:hypothetical protein